MLSKSTIFLGLGLFSLQALADREPWTDLPEQIEPFVSSYMASSEYSRAYGATAYTILQIPASAFRPQTADGRFSWTTHGYLKRDADSLSDYLWAPVQLPSGALVEQFNLYYSDDQTDPNLNIEATLTKHVGFDQANPPGEQYIAFVASPEGAPAPGYGYASTALSHTINNNAHGDPANGGSYSIEVKIPANTGSTLAFKGVDLWWKRQISPAPLTATFTDVPTTHVFFREIEALRASGITTGTTPTTYNPNGTLTRAQMAVFLARALGLHYPN